MIHRVLKYRRNAVRNPFDYLVKKPREVEAEVLRGDPDMVWRIARELPFARKYFSVVLSFVEDIPRPLIDVTIGGYEKTAFAGTSPEAFARAWVLHREKGRTELHGIIAAVHLPSGLSWSHYWYKADESRFAAWTAAMNAEHGWHGPDHPRAQSSPEALRHLSKVDRSLVMKIDEQLESEVQSGRVQNRSGVLSWLRDRRLFIERTARDYITIRRMDADRGIRLRGGKYQQDFQADHYLAACARIPKPNPGEAQRWRKRLAQLTRRREHYVRQRFGDLSVPATPSFTQNEQTAQRNRHPSDPEHREDAPGISVEHQHPEREDPNTGSSASVDTSPPPAGFGLFDHAGNPQHSGRNDRENPSTARRSGGGHPNSGGGRGGPLLPARGSEADLSTPPSGGGRTDRHPLPPGRSRNQTDERLRGPMRADRPSTEKATQRGRASANSESSETPDQEAHDIPKILKNHQAEWGALLHRLDAMPLRLIRPCRPGLLASISEWLALLRERITSQRAKLDETKGPQSELAESPSLEIIDAHLPGLERLAKEPPSTTLARPTSAEPPPQPTLSASDFLAKPPRDDAEGIDGPSPTP